MSKAKPPSPDDLAVLRERYEYTSKVFSDADSPVLLAEVLLALGEITPARRTISDFIAKRGDSVRARIVLAKANLMCWKAVSAEEELKRALELDAGDREASLLLMQIYRSAGKFAEASRVASSLHSVSGERGISSSEVSELKRLAARTEAEKKSRSGIFETDTILNLYVSQGLYEDALRVIDALCGREPDNDAYCRRREEIAALMSAR